jgi:hypothetical protein
MRTLTLALLLTVAIAAPSLAQSSIDWAAKERGMVQAIKDKKFETFAAGVDSAFVGVYPTGVINRAAQIAAVKTDSVATFQMTDFTTREIDPQMVLLAYKATVTGKTNGTFWVSSVWRRRGNEWRTVLHTAAVAATKP